jgi:hypothetical protein
VEVAIGDGSAEEWDVKKVCTDGYVLIEGISEGLARCNSIFGSRENIFTQYGESGARAAHGYASINERLESVADRRMAPEPNVVPLISTGDEERLRVPDFAIIQRKHHPDPFHRR